MYEEIIKELDTLLLSGEKEVLLPENKFIILLNNMNFDNELNIAINYIPGYKDDKGNYKTLIIRNLDYIRDEKLKELLRLEKNKDKI